MSLNNNNIKLSICIPVFNCAEFLSQALDSILSQVSSHIEVIVYDGGSNDETPELMMSYITKWATFVRYYRADIRGGIDADMAKCVSFAEGEYCWLFSGDDVMRNNSISIITNEIDSNHDVYVCKHTICDKNMAVSHEHPILNTEHSIGIDFICNEDRQMWFSIAETNEAFFSFMSGLIVKKSTWDFGRLISEFNGSCWAHVARLFEISKTGLKVKYIPKILLDKRGDNDSFAQYGIVNRFRIGIDGYHQIANYFFGANSIEAFHIRRVIRNEFTLKSFLYAKIQTIRHPLTEDRILLDKLIVTTYQDKSIYNYFVRAAYKTFPYSLFLMIRLLYKSYIKFKLTI